MVQPTVSVVIATNRGGPYLQETVESALRQTVPVTEVILVDDGSPPDAGLELFATECGLRYVRQQASGVSAARNRGAALATGTWIAFLDDDDVWHARRIESQLRALAADPGAIGSHTGGWHMDSEGRPFGSGWPAPPASSADMISYRAVPPRITTLLVDRAVFLETGGFALEFSVSEDNDLILRLLQRGRFAAVDRQLVGYRRHDGNVTRRGLLGHEASRVSIGRQLHAARDRGDEELVMLLRTRMKAHRRISSSENLGEMIGAFRRHDWTYGAQTAWWGVRRVPIQSLGALWARATRFARRRVDR